MTKIQFILNIFLPTSIFAIIFLIASFLFFKAPVNGELFPRKFEIKEGETIRSVADRLETDKLIKDADIFVAFSKLSGNKVLRGVYFLEEEDHMFGYINKMERGLFAQPSIQVLVREQTTLSTTVDAIVEALPHISRGKLLKEIGEYKGMLYPNTYNFSENITEEQIVRRMREEFEEKTSGILKNYEGEFSKEDILKIASIVELEASKYADRRKIAGVILNRLEDNIPLQVDVSFLHINGKNTYSITREDLRAEHPYNSYTQTGLPPTPIANVTAESLSATINPEKNDYFFFLTDRNGKTYFSETYKEHIQKKNLYINYNG